VRADLGGARSVRGAEGLPRSFRPGVGWCPAVRPPGVRCPVSGAAMGVASREQGGARRQGGAGRGWQEGSGDREEERSVSANARCTKGALETRHQWRHQ
jgi:hypothetical protein